MLQSGAGVVSAAAWRFPGLLMAASHYGIPSFPIVKFVIYHVTAWILLKLSLHSIFPPFPFFSNSVADGGGDLGC